MVQSSVGAASDGGAEEVMMTLGARLGRFSRREQAEPVCGRLKVAIIQPWLPQYRVAFFEKLIQDANAVGIDIRVFHGRPQHSMAERGDAVEADWATEMPTKFFSVRGRTLNWKSLKDFLKGAPYDLVVVEQALKNLETYRVRLMRRTKRLAFWGHGKTYTEDQVLLVERLKSRLTMRGDWFFAYTQGGAKAVVEAGFPASRVTVLNNSVDTAGLQCDIANVRDSDVKEFKRRHDLAGRTAMYIGALDEGKRISWLISSSGLAYELDPMFRLLIVGDGKDRPVVERAARMHEWVVYCGPLFGPSKAVALAACEIIAMPGRVGLTAVDSFAAERPIVTTEWPKHAPEFEYLESGVNALIVPDEAEVYSRAMCSLLNDKEQLFYLRQGCKESAKKFSIERMAGNFLSGIRSALDQVG